MYRSLPMTKPLMRQYLLLALLGCLARGLPAADEADRGSTGAVQVAAAEGAAQSDQWTSAQGQRKTAGAPDPVEAIGIAVDAYVFGYPPVTFDTVRQQNTNLAAPDAAQICAVTGPGWSGTLPEDAIYPLSLQDAEGHSYDASRHDYLLRLQPGKMPPADAFWSPTLYFSDRPVRIAGHMAMPAYLDEWTAGAGPDNFGADPPNATLSVLEPGKPQNTLVVVEISHPVVDGNDLVYAYKLIEGEMPESGGATALFIDWIGVGGGVGPGFHGVGVGRRGIGWR